MSAAARAGALFGVAIAIPQPHALVLSRWRERVGDPDARRILPHVTLLPPTKIPVDAVDEVQAHLRGVAATHQPFAMHLSGTGTFRPISPVVFVQVANGIGECELLERDVRCGPLDRALEFPYHPHVTIAHNIADSSLDEAYDGLGDYVARFRVDRFALFSRGYDGRWEWHSEFGLGQPALASGVRPGADG